MPEDLLPPTDPADEIADLRERIAALEQQIREAIAAGEAHSGEVTRLGKELAALMTKAKSKKWDGFFEVDAEGGDDE
jgi:hypothetical protein